MGRGKKKCGVYIRCAKNKNHRAKTERLKETVPNKADPTERSWRGVLRGHVPSKSPSADGEISRAHASGHTEKVGEKSDSFSRAERTRPLRPASRLQYYDFANVPAERLQRYTMTMSSAEKGFSAADAKSEESQSGAGERAATFETCLSRRICRGGRFFIGAGRLAERNEKTV